MRNGARKSCVSLAYHTRATWHLDNRKGRRQTSIDTTKKLKKPGHREKTSIENPNLEYWPRKNRPVCTRNNNDFPYKRFSTRLARCDRPRVGRLIKWNARFVFFFNEISQLASNEPSISLTKQTQPPNKDSQSMIQKARDYFLENRALVQTAGAERGFHSFASWHAKRLTRMKMRKTRRKKAFYGL